MQKNENESEKCHSKSWGEKEKKRKKNHKKVNIEMRKLLSCHKFHYMHNTTKE